MSMMPKSRHGFLGDIMLYLIKDDHVHAFGSIRAEGMNVIMSMMPKSRHGFLGDIMLSLIEDGHVHAFGSIRAEGIVI